MENPTLHQNQLCEIIKDTVRPNFINLRAALHTYDRDALCCGAPCWRWAYHTIHSADKWFFNPFVYEEPAFHEDGMDNPYNPCTVTLSDEQLLSYLGQVEQKTLSYLDTLTDAMLYEQPAQCHYTRMELVLRQYRHLNFHTGLLNGQTVVQTGKFPIWVGDAEKFTDNGEWFEKR